MAIKIPKGKVYKGKKGWRVKGWRGTSPTKKSAERRYRDTIKRYSGLKVLIPIAKEGAFLFKELGGIEQAMRGWASKDPIGDFKRARAKYELPFEKKRTKIIKSRQQKKLTRFV